MSPPPRTATCRIGRAPRPSRPRPESCSSARWRGQLDEPVRGLAHDELAEEPSPRARAASSNPLLGEALQHVEGRAAARRRCPRALARRSRALRKSSAGRWGSSRGRVVRPRCRLRRAGRAGRARRAPSRGAPPRRGGWPARHTSSTRPAPSPARRGARPPSAEVDRDT